MNETNLRQMESDIEWIERELQHCCRTKPETNPQAKVLEAMRYSQAASGFVLCWCWLFAVPAAEMCKKR